MATIITMIMICLLTQYLVSPSLFIVFRKSLPLKLSNTKRPEHISEVFTYNFTYYRFHFSQVLIEAYIQLIHIVIAQLYYRSKSTNHFLGRFNGKLRGSFDHKVRKS